MRGRQFANYWPQFGPGPSGGNRRPRGSNAGANLISCVTPHPQRADTQDCDVTVASSRAKRDDWVMMFGWSGALSAFNFVTSCNVGGNYGGKVNLRHTFENGYDLFVVLRIRLMCILNISV